MRSTRSTKLPRWAEWMLSLLCVGLGVAYWAEPARGVVLTSLGSWVELGTSRADDVAWLKPSAAAMAGAKPLIDYGDLRFLGCDLSLRGNTVELVTFWRRAEQTDSRALLLRFVLPESGAPVIVEQPLSADTLYTPLPANFYAARRGEVWLKVIQSSTGQSVSVSDSLQLADANGWIRVCR